MFKDFIINNMAVAGALDRDPYQLPLSVPWSINGHVYTSKVGQNAYIGTKNVHKCHQVHACINSHMHLPPKMHNMVPPRPFYKPSFLFESRFCVQYNNVFEYHLHLIAFE